MFIPIFNKQKLGIGVKTQEHLLNDPVSPHKSKSITAATPHQSLVCHPKPMKPMVRRAVIGKRKEMRGRSTVTSDTTAMVFSRII